MTKWLAGVFAFFGLLQELLRLSREYFAWLEQKRRERLLKEGIQDAKASGDTRKLEQELNDPGRGS